MWLLGYIGNPWYIKKGVGYYALILGIATKGGVIVTSTSCYSCIGSNYE